MTPPSGSVFITDTLQLSATVRDQNGAAMTGKSVTWSSGNQSLATVSASGLVIGVAAGSVSISAAAEGKTGTSTLAVADPGPRITKEAATAASKTIGSEGGTVATTSSAGVSYSLIVPPNALPGSQLITITPITAVRKLPLSGGLVGGVEFLPAGLQFALPARLRISIAQRPPAGMQLLALAADGDGSLLLPEPSLDSGTVASVPVLHFSSMMAGFGTQAQVSQLLAAGGGLNTNSQLYGMALLRLVGATPQDVPVITQTMKDWFDHVILPLFQNATTDALLIAAVSEYNWWRYEVPLALGLPPASTPPGPYAAELAQLAPIAAAKIGAAIDANNVVCRTQKSFSALANVLFWQTQAGWLDVATAAFHLDRASVLQALCVRVVLESSVLPDPMDVGTPYSLDATFGVQFLQNGAPQGAAFGMTLTTAQLTVAHPTGATSNSGFYTTVVSPTGPGPVTVDARACLILPGTTNPSDVCGSGTVQSNGRGACGRIVAGAVTISSDANVTANADVKQAGSVTIQGNFTNPVALDCLERVTGTFTMTGLAPSFSAAKLAFVGSGLSIDPTKLDGMTSLVLPLLAEVDGTISLSGNRAASVTTPLQVSLPALRIVGDFGFSSTRKFDLVLGSVTSTQTINFSGAGLRSLQTGAVTTSGVLNVGPADDLITISLGALKADFVINIGPLENATSLTTGTVTTETFNLGPTTRLPTFTIGVVTISGTMNVGPNDALVSLGGGGGTVGGTLNVGPNPKLSTAVAVAWAATFATGAVNTGGNKIP